MLADVAGHRLFGKCRIKENGVVRSDTALSVRHMGNIGLGKCLKKRLGVLRPAIKQRRHGFTLIEVLIVIAIIALLLTLIVPVAARARQQAKWQVCRGNVRQLDLALRMFAQENPDNPRPRASYLPSVSPAPLDTEQPVFIADVLSAQVGGQARVFGCPGDRAGLTEREPPNTSKSYFQSERSSYVLKARWEGYERFHYGHYCHDDLGGLLNVYDH